MTTMQSPAVLPMGYSTSMVAPPPAPHLHARAVKTGPVYDGPATAVPLTSAALQMHTGMLPIHRTFSGQSIASLGYEANGKAPVVIQRISTAQSLATGQVFTGSTSASSQMSGCRDNLGNISRLSSNASVESSFPAAAASPEDILDFVGGGRPLRPSKN